MYLVRNLQLKLSHHGTHVRCTMWGGGRFRPWFLALVALGSSVVVTIAHQLRSGSESISLSVMGTLAGIFVLVWGALLLLGAMYAFLLRRTVIIAGPQGWSVTTYLLLIPLRRCRGRFPFRDVREHVDTYTVVHRDATGAIKDRSRVRRAGLELSWNDERGKQRLVRFAHGLRGRATLMYCLKSLNSSGGTVASKDAPLLVHHEHQRSNAVPSAGPKP